MKTMQETADIFNVHYQTIRNWIKEGIIKPIRINNVIRISDEEIERVKAGVSIERIGINSN